MQAVAAVVGASFGERFGLFAGALAVELLESGADAAAEVGEFVLHGALGAGEDGVAFGLDGVASFGQAGADFFGFLAGESLGADLVGDGVALLLELAEELFHGGGLGGGVLAGAVEDAFGHAESLGDGEGIGASGGAHEESVGGLEGDGVELGGGVDDAVGGVGEDLELAVVGGGDDHAVEVEQFLEQGAGEGGALGGVGAGAELVEQDEGARSGGLDDADDVGHVGGEGGEGLFDRLFVADVGEDVVEDGDAGAGLGGDWQSGLGHEAEQSDGLEGDGLAAGVGSGDEDAAGVGGECGGDGDDVAGEERVTGGVEDEVGVGVVVGGANPVEGVVLGGQGRVELGSEPRLGLGEVDLGEAADGGSDGSGFFADRFAEGAEDAVDLALLFASGFAQAIAEFDDGERLDEEGGSGGGDVVDDGGHLATEFGLDRDDVASVALGDQGLLGDALGDGVAEGALELLFESVLDGADAVAGLGEGAGGVVGDFAALVDGGFDLSDYGGEVGDALGDAGELGQFAVSGAIWLRVCRAVRRRMAISRMSPAGSMAAREAARRTGGDRREPVPCGSAA